MKEIFIVIGVSTVVMISGYYWVLSDYRDKAINNGCAQYNPKTAVFEWKPAINFDDLAAPGILLKEPKKGSKQ